ncbi:MAG: hypothetical protein M1470_04255 [Bacteroidetes bacterium]|nr:hypothetical protein [Bacteroidota bacterium]
MAAAKMWGDIHIAGSTGSRRTEVQHASELEMCDSPYEGPSEIWRVLVGESHQKASRATHLSEFAEFMEATI